MKVHRITALHVAVLVFATAALACGQLTLSQETPPAWTPAASPAQPASGSDILPTVATTPGGMTAEPIMPAETEVATATPEPAATLELPTPAPTVDPHRVIITESGIASVISASAASGGDVQAEGLTVNFRGGKTYIRANQVKYGFISLQNLDVTGRLVARDGALQMDVESVSPQGIVGAMIPGLINQALRQYSSSWYVEDVQTSDGQIEVRIR